MSNALATTILDDPSDFTVIANSPAEMETAQRSLILWAARKIQSIKGELDTAKEQYGLCVKNKWSTHGWRSQITKNERRADFYRKIKGALEAGYYIVPPFPIDVFAIRTAAKKPKEYISHNSNNHDQPAQLLAAGEGRYVDPRPVRDSFVEDEKRGDKMVPVAQYYATEFKDVDFPFKLARAEIREASDRAMSLKIFDRLGILPRKRKPDPIVCGQILVPGQSSWRMDGRHGDPEAITFFVTWWLDTKTL